MNATVSVVFDCFTLGYVLLGCGIDNQRARKRGRAEDSTTSEQERHGDLWLDAESGAPVNLVWVST